MSGQHSAYGIDPDTFRHGLFNLYTRRFGSAAEFLVRRLIKAASPRNLFHDLYDDALRHRIEVKFSRVFDREEPLTFENFLRAVEAAGRERAVPFANWRNHSFDCNIQQIKRADFDILYYGLFFSDAIVIFKTTSGQLKTPAEISQAAPGHGYINVSFSDFQHRGNIGEGQFHINNRTLDIHLRHFHYHTLSYGEFLALLGSS
jgi:hypothetical protein